MVGTSNGRLTEAFIRSIKEPCKHGDGHGGHGLTFVARDRAGGGLRRFWRQNFTNDGRKRSTGLGGYPLITLKEARYKAFDNARKIARGEDILAPKREIPTVDQAFDQYMANRTPEWKQKGKRKAKAIEDRWNVSKTYCLPILSKRVSDVNAEDVLNVFRPIWIPHRATANHVLTHLHQVMDLAIEMQYRTTNPASASVLRSLGTQPEPEPRPAAPYKDLGGYLSHDQGLEVRVGPKILHYVPSLHRRPQRRGQRGRLERYRLGQRDSHDPSGPDEKRHQARSPIAQTGHGNPPICLEQTPQFQRHDFPAPARRYIPRQGRLGKNHTRTRPTVRTPRPPKQFHRLGL